jgi:hypothetical protein
MTLKARRMVTAQKNERAISGSRSSTPMKWTEFEDLPIQQEIVRF